MKEAAAWSKSKVIPNLTYLVQCSSLMSDRTTGEDLRNTARLTVVIIWVNNNRRGLRRARPPSVRKLAKVLQLETDTCIELTSSPTNEIRPTPVPAPVSWLFNRILNCNKGAFSTCVVDYANLERPLSA